MDKEIMGTVVSVKKQWWLKINTKPVRTGPLDGAIFPHIIKVQYTVDGKTYTKRKWIGVNSQPPVEGSSVTVLYYGNNPKKAKILTDASYQKDTVLLKDKQESENQTHFMPIGMCLGMSIGTAIGVATDNLATGMCIGLSIGVGIGALLDSKKRKETEAAAQKDEDAKKCE
jgi:hypothetical protein